MEAGRQDSVEGQTKLLSDHYKLAKALKDQVDFIYKWLPGGQKQRITEVEVFGILSSGTLILLLYKGYNVILVLAISCYFYESHCSYC